MTFYEMDKYDYMKSFITNNSHYSKHRNEKLYNSLQRDLQILCVSSDPSIFNPDSSIAAEFYVSLHELLSSLESQSSLMWCGVSILQSACHNPSARHALVHTYKFAPVFTRLLGAHLTQEKRLQILNLLHQLTFGVKISWQEAHLPHLMATLTEWILGNDNEVVELSLGILVNLCHKNLPAVYTLMRTIDHKEFIRTIFKVQHNNINIRVQVCKMLIILQHICNSIPDNVIKDFVDASFASLMEASKNQDVFLMKHIVDFFGDVAEIDYTREVLLTYENFLANTAKLLDFLDDDKCKPECVAVVFVLILALLKLKLKLNDLHTRIIAVAFRWVQTEAACTNSLELIRLVALNAKINSDSHSDVMEQLSRGFDVLLPLLDVSEREVPKVVPGVQVRPARGFDVLLPFLDSGDGVPKFSPEAHARLAALFQLLQLMCQNPLLRHKILTAINPNIFRKMFDPLLVIESNYGKNLFETDVTSLYVYTLSFMSNLVPHDAQWLGLYVELLQKKQVQVVLAAALYTGNQDVKQQVLTLAGTTGFPNESLSSLAKSMCDLEPIIVLPSSSFKKDTVSTAALQHDMTPLYTATQESRLNQFIERLDEVMKRKEINNISTSAVMELYEYKLASVTHAEKALLANLEAATNHATNLQHRLAQVGLETSRLHQLLFHNQQCLEGLKAEKQAVELQLEESAQEMEVVHKKHIGDLKLKQQIVAQKEAKTEEIEAQLSKKESLLRQSEEKIKEIQQELMEHQGKIKKLEDYLTEKLALIEELKNVALTLESRLAKREKIIQQKDAQIADSNKSVNDLRSKLTTSEMVCKVHEKNTKEKDEELETTRLQLAELQRVRDAIFEISNPGKCRKNEK